MPRLVAVVPLLLALLSPDAFAQPARERFIQVLFPLAFEGEIAGAHGSRWILDSWGRNDADHFVIVSSAPDLRCAGPRCVVWAPAKTTFPGPAFSPGARLGAFVYVEKEYVENVHFGLRVRDVSRPEISFGTAIPVVREDELRRGTIVLLDVPRDPLYRVSLRVYTNDPAVSAPPEVTVWEMEGNTPLGAPFLEWRHPPRTGSAFDAWPVTAEAHDLLAALPGAASEPSRVRIEIRSPSPAWAFATVTNRDTQQVTVIAP